MVENPPASAEDTGSSPGLGRSHMLQSGWAREPQLLSLRVWSLCSTTGEAMIVRGLRTAMKSGPHLPQLEKALTQKRRPNTAINKLINKILKKKVLTTKTKPILNCLYLFLKIEFIYLVRKFSQKELQIQMVAPKKSTKSLPNN